MRIIENSGVFEQVIAENAFVLAYFSGLSCSVCHALKPKIEKLINVYFPDVLLVEISTEQQPELAARLSVFTIPVILFYVDGKEYIREVRFIDLSVLEQKLRKILSMYKR
jgi:thioredoxin 1